MHDGCVTLQELVEIARHIFYCGALIWNAGNFYEIVISHSKEALCDFMNMLPEPFVPYDYRIETEQVRILFEDGKIIRS